MAFEKADEFKRESDILAKKIIHIIMSSDENEESLDDSREETEIASGNRKRSLLERFVRVLFSNETNESHSDDSARETQPSGVKADDTSERLTDLITQVKELDKERKKSFIMCFVDGLVQMLHQEQPAEIHTATIEGDANEDAEDTKDEAECSTCCLQDTNVSKGTEKLKEDNESAPQTEHNEGAENTSMNSRERKIGVTYLEDHGKVGIHNLGYQSGKIETENQIETCSETVKEMLTCAEAKNKQGSFCERQHRFEKSEEGYVIEATCDSELSTSLEERNPRICTNADDLTNASNGKTDGILELRDEPVTNVDSSEFVTCESDTYHTTAKTKPRMAKDWLVNPHLYKVAVIVTCSRLVLDVVFAYLPLYLTERMGFGMQAIAYFPLVLLVSGTLASTLSVKLSAKLGSKWTYILASFFVMCGSVYCYFQTPSLRQSTYAPVILIGSGMSVMYALSLAFATDLIGEDKERSGFAFSVIVIIARLSSGGLIMAIQEFYPEDDSGSNTNVSSYIRHVFSVVSGLLAFTGFFVVLFFHRSLLRDTKKELASEGRTSQTDGNTASLDVVVVPG